MTFADRALAVIQQLRTDASVPDETIVWFRLHAAVCRDPAGLAAIIALSQEAATDGFGTVELNGQVGGAINLTTATFHNVQDDTLALTIRKHATPQWCYFLSTEGATTSLAELAVGPARAVWVAGPCEAFSTGTLHICPWGGPRGYAGLHEEMELPRKLVRDQTYNLTPHSVIPWLLVHPPAQPSPLWPAQPSPLFTRWRRLAFYNLAFVLPFEIRAINGTDYVVLKGPRSQPIAVAPPQVDWDGQGFEPLVEATRWVYSPRRDAEAKFLFLNRELSLGWRDGDRWPEGLVHTLRHSFTSARDEFAFYLQDQSRDALKSLADLRKGLQEEVAKTQQATRELLATLWRDFAVAALVLALRSPPISSTAILHPEVVRLVTLAAAALLTISLLITIVSNARFNALSNRSRADWRHRLYAFLSDADWNALVEIQLRAGRWVYRAVVVAMVLAYLAAILYLINLAEPGIIERTWTGIAQVASKLFGRSWVLGQDLWELIRAHMRS
jgi:hypothetical protein